MTCWFQNVASGLAGGAGALEEPRYKGLTGSGADMLVVVLLSLACAGRSNLNVQRCR